MADYTLRTDVSFDVLLTQSNVNLTAEQKEKVEAYALDGFDENELTELEQLGVSEATIKKLCEVNEPAATKATKTDEEITARAKELSAKYCANLESYDGDIYSASNPMLQALKKAINDGVVGDLAKEGYTKLQIVKVISEAFPKVGIEVRDDKYTLPHGHGDEAKEIYNSFKTKLLSAAGGDSPELQAAKQKLKGIYTQITDNNNKIQAIEFNIIQLQDEIEEIIDENIDKSKEIAKEHKEDSKKAVKTRLNEYSNSNGSMSYDEFQAKLKGDLDSIAGSADSELAKVVSNMVNAERKMATLSGYLDQIKQLMTDNTDLTAQIPEVQQEIDDITAEQEAENESATDEDSISTDPIGFTTDSNTRYDLFVDKDGNNDITNEQEFLGAEQGFKELQALDTDGDGSVTKAELASADIKIIQTNSDGTQEIKNAADVFADGDSIELKSYEAKNYEMSNGNQLLGTFDLTFKNKFLDNAGYQTLDKLGWLDANYEFTEEKEGTGRFADSFTGEVEALDFTENMNKYQAKFDEQQGKLDEIWTNIGIDSNEVRTGLKSALNASQSDAQAIETAFEQTALRELQEAQEAQEEEAQAVEAAEKDAGQLTKEECEQLGIDLTQNGIQEIDGKKYKVEDGKVVEITEAE